MHKLHKFFILASVLIFASCINELESGQTDTDGADEGSFVLEVSIDDPTRTALGSSDASVYHTVWNEGDVISVNGIMSYPVPAESAGKSKAAFSFDGFPMLPLNILYPATEKSDLVELPMTQTYVKDSFDPCAAVMYGTSDGFENVTLAHLSSVLRFSFTSAEETKIKCILVKEDSKEPLAGTFEMEKDGKGAFTGKISPSAGASSMVMLDCGEGVALSSEATPFHVAVPYGTYSGFSIQVIAMDGSVMQLGYTPVNSGVLAPSKVVVFPDKAFVADGVAKLIANEADLLAFAETATEYSTVVLMDDIAITSEEFTSIKDFSGTFEGGDYTVSGLKTPLFDNLTGNVSNLTVAGEITDDASSPVGLLARTAAEGTIVNCHSNGSVKVAPVESAEIIAGGLVGKITSSSVASCTNDAPVEVDLPALGKTLTCYAGGLTGYFDASGASITSSSNNVSVDVVIQPESAVKLYCAGCVGMAFYQTSDQDADITFRDVVNKGDVTVDGVLKFGSGEKDRSMIAGIVAKAYVKGTAAKGVISMAGCVNEGDVTLKNSCGSERAYVAGLVGDAMCSDFTETSCSNAGNITVEGPGKYLCLAGHIGIIMRESATNVTVKDAVNTGNITLNEDLALSADDLPSAPCYAGGVIGMANGPGSMLTLNVAGCTNSGTIHRMIANMDDVNEDKEVFSFAGGIVGSIGNTHKVSNDDFVTAVIDKCSNSGQITFNQYTGENDYKEAYHYCSFTGGIVGLSRAMNGSVDVKYCMNSGNLQSTAGTHGGIVGFAQSSTAIYGDVTNYCTNTGTIGMRDIKNNSEKSSGQLVSGGICGYLKGEKDNVTSKIEYCWNDAVVAGSVKAAPGAGGIVAWTTVTDLVKYCKNSGSVRCMNGRSWEAGVKGQASGLISGSKSDKPVSHCAAGGYIARNGGAWVTMTPAGGEKPFHNYVYTNTITAEAAAEAGIEFWDGVSKTSWEE